MNKPKFETPDMTQKNIDKISQLFPNCIEYERVYELLSVNSVDCDKKI